jgi:hypothetical protein
MHKYFIFLLLTLPLSSCWRNPNFQGRGENYIQGEWKQDSVSMQKQLLSYSLYQYKFDCDSVFVTIHSFSKVNTGADTCMNKGTWMEYIRGTYTQKHDTLHIKGLFCKADFSLKKEGGCFRSGVYEEDFKVSKKTDSLVQFSSLSNVIPVNLHLIKSITCNPKPL